MIILYCFIAITFWGCHLLKPTQSQAGTLYGQVAFAGEDSLKVQLIETKQEVFVDKQGFFELTLPIGYKQINLQFTSPKGIAPTFNVAVKPNRNIFGHFRIKRKTSTIYQQNEPVLWVEYEQSSSSYEERFSDVNKRIHLTGLYPFEAGCEDMQQYGLRKTNRELGLPCKASIIISKAEQDSRHFLLKFEIYKGKPIDVYIPKMDFELNIGFGIESRDWVYYHGARYTYLRYSDKEFNLEKLNQPTCEIFNPSPEYYRMEHVIPPPPPFTCNYLNKQ